MKTKLQILQILVFVFLFSEIYAQTNYFKLYTPPERSQGRRLEISGRDFLTYEKVDSINQDFRLRLNADYRQWMFTPLNLFGGYVNADANINTRKTNSDTSLTDEHFLVNAYGGISRYLTPKGFYGTLALGISYGKEKLDTTFTGARDSRARVPAYGWGAIGYGRINNSERVRIAMDFIGRLKARNVITGSVSPKTILALTDLLDKRDNGDFEARDRDDNEIVFFSAVEKLLQQTGNIPQNLDAGSTLKLFQVLTNDKFVFYERYVGYQIQAEAQYQIDNGVRTKPHDHYLSISGIYGYPLNISTHILGTAFFAIPLDTLASGNGPRDGFNNTFNNFLPFIRDRNNLDFFEETDGTGLFGGTYVAGRNTSFGLRGDIFHNISSTAGINAFAQFINRSPKTGDGINFFDFGGRFDYNILNSLKAFLIARANKTQSSNKFLDRPFTYRISMGFSYRVF